MIRIHVKEPGYPEYEGCNCYVAALSDWKVWGAGLGLTYMPGGSEKSSLEPGQWCVQSYKRGEGVFTGRFLCFHESDRVYAIICRLVWGS